MRNNSAMGISNVERFEDQTVVTWGDGATARFHWLWLRDNCPCDQCRHPTVGERMLDSLLIPFDIEALSVERIGHGEGLAVEWSDGHRSDYNARWLTANSYDPPPRPAAPTQTWRAGFVPPDAQFAEVMADDGALAVWLQRIVDHGVTIVRNTPTEQGTVVRLAERIAHIRNSNFGPIWNVASKPDADTLAYTSHTLTLHNDLVSREMMPGVQFLHCIVFEATGGDSVLVDGYACAEHLRTTDPEAFALLTTVPVPHRYVSPTTDVRYSSPMIKLDRSGRVVEIRYSNALLAPFDVDGDRMMALYRAVRSFTTLMRAPEFAISLRLRPGDAMVFDNYRVLHGRTAFDPTSGARHLQGTYIDRDDLLSRLRVLDRATR
jgi:gamma-butyrobetaine dioxygenase